MRPHTRALVVLALVATLASHASAQSFPLKTNLSKALVPLEHLQPGGPPPDGIPPIDRPKFVRVADADRWLKGREPVMAFESQGVARAYPLQVMTWHEIVNDVVGDLPIVATFCPLCNTAIVFDRRVDGDVLDFGTSGMLYNSDLVMYDRKTHSLWIQMTGEAVVGDLIGKRLTVLPAAVVAWEEWKTAHPGGQVLSRDTGHSRPYGRNPYVGYDRVDQPPFLFREALDGRLPPMERVVAISLHGQEKAYPFPALRQAGVIHDRLGGRELVVFFRPGTASALDQASIADSKDVGATGVFVPEVEGRSLRFRVQDGQIVDRETGSRWNLLGHAVTGPLTGKRLPRILHVDTFWFAWGAFKPRTAIYAGP
ncbi:MAG: DUF3179 domain-containing protein [Candidatus Rokuibacteriota bacterium]